jgi:hypothetical protein
MPQPRTIAMEATIFTGWIYDHLAPHAEKVKVAHPLMLRAIAAAKKKNDKIDASKIADCVRCDFLPACHMASTEIRDRRRTPKFTPATAQHPSQPQTDIYRLFCYNSASILLCDRVPYSELEARRKLHTPHRRPVLRGHNVCDQA